MSEDGRVYSEHLHEQIGAELFIKQVFSDCFYCNVQLLLCISAGQVEENDAGIYSCQATYATIQEIEARVNDSTLNQQHFFLINLRYFDLCPACCGQPFNLVLSNGT